MKGTQKRKQRQSCCVVQIKKSKKKISSFHLKVNTRRQLWKHFVFTSKRSKTEKDRRNRSTLKAKDKRDTQSLVEGICAKKREHSKAAFLRWFKRFLFCRRSWAFFWKWLPKNNVCTDQMRSDKICANSHAKSHCVWVCLFVRFTSGLPTVTEFLDSTV